MNKKIYINIECYDKELDKWIPVVLEHLILVTTKTVDEIKKRMISGHPIDATIATEKACYDAGYYMWCPETEFKGIIPCVHGFPTISITSTSYQMHVIDHYGMRILTQQQSWVEGTRFILCFE